MVFNFISLHNHTHGNGVSKKLFKFYYFMYQNYRSGNPALSKNRWFLFRVNFLVKISQNLDEKPEIRTK